MDSYSGPEKFLDNAHIKNAWMFVLYNKVSNQVAILFYMSYWKAIIFA